MAVKLKPAAIRSRTLSAEHETSQSAAHELVSSRFHDKQSNTRCFGEQNQIERNEQSEVMTA